MSWLFTSVFRSKRQILNYQGAVLLVICTVLAAAYSKTILAFDEQNPDLSSSHSALDTLLAPHFTKQAAYIDEAGNRVEPRSPYATRAIRGASTYANAVAQLYTERNSTSLWHDTAATRVLVEQLQRLRDDGLTPEDYQVSRLNGLAGNSSLAAGDELLLTASLLRGLYHLSRGKVNDKGDGAVWNFNLADYPPALRSALLQTDFSARGVESLFELARPSQQEYSLLRDAYVHLLNQGDAASYPRLQTTTTLKPCQSSTDIKQLRARLSASGHFVAVDRDAQQQRAQACGAVRQQQAVNQASVAHERALEQWRYERDRAAENGEFYDVPIPREIPQDDTSQHYSQANHPDPDSVYDAELVAAVKVFQRENHLNDDGVVGAATRRALNISPRDRIDQVRINLDRARWRLPRMQDHMVLVDLAGYRLQYFVNGAVDWESRVQIGKIVRKSPVIDSTVTHITLNPSWSIPPTILKKDVGPAVRRDPGYLAKNRLTIYNSSGQKISPSAVNWSNPSGVSIRQAPGPRGALGLAAIRFPNNHSVYLHDTPHQNLFNSDQRATSSGCIRVERAMELVRRLLANTPSWSDAAIDRAIKAGKTQNARLDASVPILIAYWTVDAISPTQLIFKDDVYQRDAIMVRALAEH